ncbi:MAG: FxLYD domain-containing protein [Terriglobales bacterium]
MVRKRAVVDDFGTTITGTIKNDCGRDFSYVQVTFKLFDRSDNVVGTALANQANLKNGETWKFEATGTPAAHHDRLDEISAY